MMCLKKQEIEVYELDNQKINYSQRNNEFTWVNGDLKINAFSMCNVTSMCMALDYLKYAFPAGQYIQPEDNLADFIMNSEQIDFLYKNNFPDLYEKYKDGAKDAYTPLELHYLLSAGTNLWMGKEVTKFIETPNQDFKQTLINNIPNSKPLIVSGKFGNLNHIVCVTGIKIVNDEIVSVKIDDPYGNFRDNYKTVNGNDVWLTYFEAMSIFKPLDSDKKMYHEFV